MGLEPDWVKRRGRGKKMEKGRRQRKGLKKEGKEDHWTVVERCWYFDGDCGV